MTALAYVWLAVAVVMAVVEGMTFNLVSVWFAGGAVAAFFAALLHGSFLVQLFLFVAVSAVLLACLRPLMKKRAAVTPDRTNADRILDKTAVVTEAIDNVLAKGAVKINGVEWTARSADGSAVEVGTQVRILRIEGVKVLVEPVGVPTNV